MIDLVEIENTDQTNVEFDFYLNGKTISNVTVFQSLDRRKGLTLISNSEDSNNKLKQIPPVEFSSVGIRKIVFQNWSKLENINLNIQISSYRLGVIVDFDKKRFNSYSIQEQYVKEFSNFFSENYLSRLSDNKISIHIKSKRFGIVSVEPFEVAFYSREISLQYAIKSIEKLVAKELSEFYALHFLTEAKLLKSYRQKSIFHYFEFPDSIKITCEQYLLYFAQFLQDLGINATSNLEEEAGKVLFSVLPTDDVEALDKIREALAVYLKLPESPIIFDDSFKSMRLQQQIENLQHSQRMAARELQFSEKLLAAQSDMLHEKNLTISQLQTINEQQQKIIEKISSKSIMMDSLENKEELEELCEGLKIGKSKFLKEQLGIDLNPATFLKGIGKKIIGKPENTSIIETDDEN